AAETVGRVAPKARIETPPAVTTPPVTETPPAPASVTAKAAGDVTLEQLRNAWPQILESLQKTKMSAWTVVYTAHAVALDGDVLTLGFVSQNDVDSFKQPVGSGDGVSEYLRRAIVEILGLKVKFIAKADASGAQRSAAQKDTPKADPASTPEPAPLAAAKDAAGWAVAEIPADAEIAAPEKPVKKQGSSKNPTERSSVGAGVAESRSESLSSTARYGESVVRELLGASFIEEQESAPRVVPVPKDD
ncbi:MAG: hypothetical protein ABL886_11640, partial [Rhodoglobus sp.]